MVDLQLPPLVGPQGILEIHHSKFYIGFILDFEVFPSFPRIDPLEVRHRSTTLTIPRIPASTLERSLARARGETPESLMNASHIQLLQDDKYVGSLTGWIYGYMDIWFIYG